MTALLPIVSTSGGPPYPNPVDFDHAAAQAVLDALDSSIAVLKHRTAGDLKRAATAQKGWSGTYADQFSGQHLPWVKNESGRVLQGMLRLRASISRAMQDAVTLQGKQDQANRVWARTHGPH